MTGRLSRAVLPTGFTFTLGAHDRALASTLTRPQLRVTQLRAGRLGFLPAGRLQQLRVGRPRLARQGFACQLQSSTLELKVPAWLTGELEAFLLARLRCRPASLPELARALILPDWNGAPWLTRALALLVQARRIALCSPGRYFALPWERLGLPYVPPDLGLGGYPSLAATFWRQHGAEPNAEQEPDEAVRDVVARHFEWQRLKAGDQSVRAGKRGVTYISEYVTQGRALDALDTDRQARVLALQAAHPWLLTPAGPSYITLIGTRFRIDLTRLPDGRLWTYQQRTGEQISGGIKDGQLLVSAGKGQAWTALPSQEAVTRHFQDARLASRQGQLSVQPLGEQVLLALLAR